MRPSCYLHMYLIYDWANERTFTKMVKGIMAMPFCNNDPAQGAGNEFSI